MLSQQVNDLKVGVSGCHNGCAQPQVSDIGLHGLAKRQFGKLVPYYRLHLGGNGRDGGHIGLEGPEIPSARVRSVVSRLQATFAADRAPEESFSQWAERKTVPFFTELLDDFIVVGPDDLSQLMKDHGQGSEFEVLQLGGGECAGVATETVAAWLAEAKNEYTYCEAFINQNMFESAIDCCLNILRLTALNILYKYKIKGSNDLYQLGNQLALNVHGHSKLIARYHAFVSLIERERKVTTKQRLVQLAADIYQWHQSIVEQDKQGMLQVKTEKKLNNTGELKMSEGFDFSQELLPVAFLGIRKLLAKSNAGELQNIRIKNGEDGRVIVKGLQTLGFNVVSQQESTETSSIYLVVTGTDQVIQGKQLLEQSVSV